jgi:hypothetical protein
MVEDWSLLYGYQLIHGDSENSPTDLAVYEFLFLTCAFHVLMVLARHTRFSSFFTYYGSVMHDILHLEAKLNAQNYSNSVQRMISVAMFYLSVSPLRVYSSIEPARVINFLLLFLLSCPKFIIFVIQRRIGVFCRKKIPVSLNYF